LCGSGRDQGIDGKRLRAESVSGSLIQEELRR
jgi:hypothetical protein